MRGSIYHSFLNSLPVSTRWGEVLFFVSPKKSTQKKGDPEDLARTYRAGALRASP